MTKKLLLLVVFLCSFTSYSQVGIGTEIPDKSSVLDISAVNTGLLIPRISLDNINNSMINGKTLNAVSLLIYNTNVSTTGGSGVGFYYWDGTIWSLLSEKNSGASGWSLTGNEAESSDFLGTLNNIPLNFKVNNTSVASFRSNNSFNLTQGSEAIGLSSAAIGNNAYAEAENAFAIGKNARALKLNAIASGTNSLASNDDAAAYGAKAEASGVRSTALGYFAVANKDHAVAIGDESRGLGIASFAAGNLSNSSALKSIALGYSAESRANYSMAIGDDSYVDKDFAMALGSNSSAVGDASLSVGYKSYSIEPQAIAIGATANAHGAKSVSLGYGARTTKLGSVAIGNGSESVGQDGTALGARSLVRAANGIALGKEADAEGLNSIALGNGAHAIGENATAIGMNTIAPNANTLILGKDVNVGVGTSAPTARLQVNGSLRYVDATPGNDNGKVLTSDANGNASWQAPVVASPTKIMMRKFSTGSVGSINSIFNFGSEVFNNIPGTSYSGTTLTLPKGVYKVTSYFRILSGGAFDYDIRLNSSRITSSNPGTVIAVNKDSAVGITPQVSVFEITAATGSIDFTIVYREGTTNVVQDQSYLTIEKLQ